ncbi:hypothetical protein ES703_40687 [subsurface metagenome]
MDLSDAALILGLLIVILVLLRKQWKKSLKAKQGIGLFDAEQERPGTSSTASGREELQRPGEKHLAELQEFTEEMTAGMETRARKLDFLIQEADVKIAELKKILAEAKKNDEIPKGASSEAHFSDVYELADRGFDAIEIARKTGKKPGEVELILGLRNHKKR